MKTGSPATSLPLCALTLPSGQRLEPGRMFSRKQRTAEAGVRDRLVPPGGGGQPAASLAGLAASFLLLYASGFCRAPKSIYMPSSPRTAPRSELGAEDGVQCAPWNVTNIPSSPRHSQSRPAHHCHPSKSLFNLSPPGRLRACGAEQRNQEVAFAPKVEHRRLITR